MNRKDVLRILHERQKELVERYQVAYLSLFGSVARNEVSSDNKIGILVKFTRPTAFLQFLDLKKYLETLLGCKVDLGRPQFLRPELKTVILQEAIRVI